MFFSPSMALSEHGTCSFQTLWEAEKVQGVFGSWGGNSQKANFKEVFSASWTVRWDVKKLGHSKMEVGCDLCCQALALKTGWGQCWEDGPWTKSRVGSLWLLPKEDRSTEAEDGPPFGSNWKGKERQRTCSASLQLIWNMIDVCPYWASVYPSIKQESCPSHM